MDELCNMQKMKYFITVYFAFNYNMIVLIVVKIHLIENYLWVASKNEET